MPSPPASYPRSSHAGVGDERAEQPDRVAAAADARRHRVRQPPGSAQHLLASLGPDDLVEVPDHLGNGAGPVTVPRM